MYRIYIFLLLFICTIQSYAQSDSVVMYPNGGMQYVLTFANGSLERNIYLSPYGDTIYKWDIAKREITEYPITGEYLLHKEYEPQKQQLKLSAKSRENMPQINTGTPGLPSSRELDYMHGVFFKKCTSYTKVMREGDFTIISAYDNKVQSGTFQKFYSGKLVIKGHYHNGKMNGIWTYYPYHFYPYYDITFFDQWEREWSFIYSVLPAALIFLLLVTLGRYLKGPNYQYYFYGVIAVALTALSLRLLITFDRENVWIRFLIPAIWFTFWQAMTTLATVNLFFSGRRTNTHPIINIFCLLIGFSFSIFVLFFKHLDF